MNNYALKNTTIKHLLVVSIFALSYSVFANEKTSNELPDLLSLSLKELMNIEVSVASNFSEVKLESGASIEILSREQWQVYGANSVANAIGHMPSIMTHQVPWGGDGIAIRGYSSTASVGGIAVELDGIPLNNIFTGSALYEVRNLNLPSLNKIELIRGPGSSLYGSDAFHGVLALQSYSAEEEQTSVRYKFDSNRFKQFSISHTQDLGDGYKINASITGTDQSTQDIPFSFTDSVTAQTITSDRDNAYKAYMGVLKLGIKHSKDLTTNYAIYTMGSDNFEAVGPGQSQSPFGSVLGTQDKTVGSDDRIAVKADFNWALDNHLVLEGKTYFWHLDRDAITDVTPVGLSGFFAIQRQDQRGADLVIKQTENNWNTQWAFGLGYKKSKLINSDVALTVGLTTEKITPIIPQVESGFERNVKSAFFESRTKLFDDLLTLQTGLRLDHYNAFGNQLSPRIGFVYSPSKNSAFKLLYGEAFKAPTAGETSGGGSTLANPDINPEEINTTEFIYMFETKGTYFNITLFQSDWTDGISLVPSGDPVLPSIWENINNNEAQGIEITYRGNLDNWRWDVSGSYVDSKAITLRGDVDYVAFPKQIYNLNFGYSFDEYHLELFVINRIHINTKEGPILISIDPNIPDFVANPSELKTYWNTDITLNYQQKKYSVQLAMSNLFNKDNVLPSVWNSEGGFNTLGRNIALSVEMKF